MKYNTPEETIKLLGVSLSTLTRWRNTGQFIPEFKTPGGHSRYSDSQINKLKAPVCAENIKLEDLL